MMNLFNLSARLTLDSSDYESNISNAVSDAEKKGSTIGSKLKGIASTTAKAFTGMATVASGAVAFLAKTAIEDYAQYEQLVGGVETLFKDSSSKVIEYANNAFKTAGLSANDYMETVTSFSASLLQSLGGDTEKASEVADLAITDMSDNANKMGTSMEMIQNAYQGFAKQNYTMLDNLKLGFGGTKEEMQRLLKEASKISGIKYDISNFDDIIEAIHVVQTEMGITGTTAQEASSTIEGSLNMTKSAWTNLLTGMADSNSDFDTLVNNLVDSASAFGENILPRIEVTIQGIGQLIEKLLPPIVERIPDLLVTVLPSLVGAGTQMIESLISGLSQTMPQIIQAGVQIIEILGQALIDVAPMLLEAGLQLILTLGQALADNGASLVPTIVDLVISLCDIIIENLPMIIDVAIEIILALIQGLITALPTLVAEVPRIINSFASAIYNALPQILEAGVQILMMLIKGLIDTIPTLVANIPQIIMAIVNVFTLMNWASIGKNLITGIGEGIKSMVSNIGSIAKGVAETVTNAIKGIFTSNGGSIGSNLIAFISNGISSMLSGIVSVARNIGTSVVNAFKNIFSLSSMANIGKNLVKGIWNGISNMTGWIINKIGGFANSVISSIKGFFGIHSPSHITRDLIGVNLVKGIGVGFEEETPNLEKDIKTNVDDIINTMTIGIEDSDLLKTLGEGMVNTEIPSEIKTNANESNNTAITWAINEMRRMVTELANRPIDISVNGREFARATAGDIEEALGEYGNRYSFA